MKDQKGDEGRVKGVRKGVWVGNVRLWVFFFNIALFYLRHIMLDNLHEWFNLLNPRGKAGFLHLN